MRKTTITMTSPINDKPVNLTINENVWQWKRGKCWSCFCKNPIWFVHISDKGIASHGYCHGCTEAHVYRHALAGFPKERGGWFALEPKLVRYEIDKYSTFSPA